jgi:filamentous hemagglutinin family protein
MSLVHHMRARQGKAVATLAFASLILFQASAAFAQPAPNPVALPRGGVVSHGQADIHTAGPANAPVLNIDQGSARAVINWNTFDVGSAATVNFNQPDARSATLNRVQDLNPSRIFGRINATGQVTLINPAGVYFSPTAVLDVGALTATSMQQSDADFMAGKADFHRDGATGSVVNDGAITAGLGGYIALLAPEVRNQGVIVAQQGAVALASGDAIRLNFDPASRLASLTVTPAQIAGLVENHSAVRAPGGLIILSATAVDRLTGSVINGGKLDASSLAAKGGRIVLEGDSVTLAANSHISANGATGGGEVLVGGDWQGSGSLRQAHSVTMVDTAGIDASATTAGDGGKVVLWSDVHLADGKTAVAGRIDAHGAGAAGVGGKIETSGHQLSIADTATVFSGTGGKWLLDPADVTISSSADSNHNGGFVPDDSAASAVVNVSTLLAALNAGTDVTVTTTNAGSSGAGTGDITVSNAIATTGAGAGGLTLDAAHDVTVAANITLTGTGKGLTLKAGHDIFQNASVVVTTAGGAAIYNSDSDGNHDGAIVLRNVAQVLTNGGNITFGGGSDPATTPAYGNAANTDGIVLITRVGATNGAILNAAGGNIILNGQSNGAAGSNGVTNNNYGQIKTTGAGSIRITGNGGANGAGIAVDRTTVSVQNGNIDLIGTSASSYGVVQRVGVALESTGSGAINVTAIGGLGLSLGLSSIPVSIGGNSDTGNITLTTDKLTITDSAVTLKSAGALTIKPYTAGATIGLAGGAGTLQLPASYFSTNFVNSFSSITIGDNSAGDLTVGGALSSANPLSLVTSGNLAVNAAITLSDAGEALGLKAGENISQAASVAISTTGGAVTYNSDSDESQTGAIGLRNGASVTTNGGNIIMGGGSNPLTTPAYGSAAANPFGSAISLDGTNVVLDAGGGNINLNGRTQWYSSGGVAANWQTQIKTTGNGNITIVGNGGANGYGVGLDRTTISAQNGTISITGTSANSGTYAVVSRVGNKIESTGSGPINITGIGGAGLYVGGWGQNFVIGGDSASGNITLTADLFTISDAQATIKTTGALTIKPYTAGTTIGIGGGSGTLQIPSSYFTTNFIDGFSGITIGDGFSGNATIDGANATSDSLSVITGGNLTLNAGASLSSSQAGGTLSLAAGGNFINNSGATAVSTTDAGATDRWVVYSAAPATDTFGGLVSGNKAVWGETFTTRPPAAVAAGNRYVFSMPGGNITATTTDAVKIYGALADVSANVAYSGLAISSAATYGNVFDNYTLAEALSTLPAVNSSGAVATASVAGGPYAITASGGVANSGFTLSYANTGLLTVDKAHLTVTADNQNRFYGAANPTLTTTVSGFVNGETLATSGVTGSGAASTTATAGTGVGSSAITAATGTLSADNYDFTHLVNGTLTIDKAHLTVTANNQSRLYGAANPALTTTVSGFVNGETFATSGVTGSGSASTTATAATNVGTATISAGAGTLVASNYDFTTLIDGTLTIDKAHLTVIANNQSRLYGAANPALTTTVSGFVNGETLATSGVTGIGDATTLATPGTSVGAVAITANAGALSAGNYDFTNFLDGTLTIDKAHLTVAANNDNRTYNGSAYTGGNGVTYTGFVNGENSGVLGGTLNYTGTSQGAVNAGNYLITPEGLTSGNYSLDFVSGALTISPAALSAIVGNLTGTSSKVYDGTTLATLAPDNYLFSGFAPNEGVTVTKTTGAFDDANAGSGKRVTVNLAGGDYAPTGGTALSNYTLPTTISGPIGTITPKSVTFTAPVLTKTYDGNTSAAGTPEWLAQLNKQLGVAGDSVTGITLNYDNKNVGSGKGLNVSSATINDGNSGNNYAITYAGNNGSSITRLNSVAWTGGVTGNWFDAANWAGGAVPDLSNVATVVIPAGVTVNFAATAVSPAQSETVHVDRIDTAGGLTMSAGELDVGPGGITVGGFRQTGGSLNTQGAATLQNFDQSGGDFFAAGDFATTQRFNQRGAGRLIVNGTTGIAGSDAPIVLGNLDATGAVTVISAGGAISQSEGTALTVHGSSDFRTSDRGQPAAINLAGSGNDFSGLVSADGSDVTITDRNALTVGMVNATGTVALAGNGALNLGTIAAGGNFSAASGGGDITQTGPLSVTGRATLASGSGSVTLTDPQNVFGSSVIASGTGVVVRDPLADAIAQRYARLETGGFSAAPTIPTAKNFTIDDIARVFTADNDDFLGMGDNSDGISLTGIVHF